MKPEQVRSLIGLSVLVLIALVALMLPHKVRHASAVPREKPEPPYMDMTGVVRDFIEWNEPGGHPDFDNDGRSDTWNPCGGGVYVGLVDDELGSDGKPVYTGPGSRVTKTWTDKDGRPISPTLFNAALGDVAGEKTCAGGCVQSAATFNQWYRDEPGVNISSPLTIRLERQSDGIYVFDDKIDEQYAEIGGFFPIDGQLFGDSPNKRGAQHNYHFTFELATSFTYKAEKPQIFRFLGDDDVWVFIDGKLVIDLGSTHSASEQYVDLSRLGLIDGETYSFAFFFAERNRVASNFRVETTLELKPPVLPSITAAFD